MDNKEGRPTLVLKPAFWSSYLPAHYPSEIANTMDYLPYMHFINTINSQISPSGLKATGSTNALVKTSISFSEGKHRWEIICPSHTKNIEFQFLSPIPSNCFSFSFDCYSTRKILFELDMENLMLLCFIEGYEVRRFYLKRTEYTPAVLFVKPNEVALNPFVDDFVPMIKHRCYFKQILSDAVLVAPVFGAVIDKAFLEGTLHVAFDDISNIYAPATDGKSNGAFLLTFKNRKEQNIKIMEAITINGVSIKAHSNEKLYSLFEMALRNERMPDQTNSFDPFSLQKVIQSIEEMITSELKEQFYNHLSSKYHQIATIEQSSILPIIYAFRSGNVAINGCQIAYSKDLHTLSANFKNSEISNEHDHIYLTLNDSDKEILTKDVHWRRLARLSTLYEIKAIDAFYQSLRMAQSIEGNYSMLHLPVSSALISAVAFIKWIHYEQAPHSIPSHLITPPIKLSILTSIAHSLIDQILSISINSNGRAALANMVTSLHRINTQYSRICTLLGNYTEQNAKSLSEVGLFSSNACFESLRHYLHSQDIDGSKLPFEPIELWKQLCSWYPKNDMMKGLPCSNVDIDNTCTHFTSFFHTEANRNKPIAVEHAIPLYDENMLITYSVDGSIIIWGVGVSLVKIAQLNINIFSHSTNSKATFDGDLGLGCLFGDSDEEIPDIYKECKITTKIESLAARVNKESESPLEIYAIVSKMDTKSLEIIGINLTYDSKIKAMQSNSSTVLLWNRLYEMLFLPTIYSCSALIYNKEWELKFNDLNVKLINVYADKLYYHNSKSVFTYDVKTTEVKCIIGEQSHSIMDAIITNKHIILHHEESICIYTLPLNSSPIIINQKSALFFMMGDNIIAINHASKCIQAIDLNHYQAEKVENKEDSMEIISKPIDPMTLTSDDLESYGSLEGAKPIPSQIENTPNMYPVSTLKMQNGKCLHHWNIKESSKSYNFDISFPQKINLDALAIELQFSKKYGLSQEEYSRLQLKEERKQDDDKKESTSKGYPILLSLYNVTGLVDSSFTKVGKIFEPGNVDEYCSIFPRPQFIFTHLHGKPFIPYSITISSHLSLVNKAHPMCTALIYGFSNIESLKYIATAIESKADYNAWLAEHPNSISEYDPIGFVDMEDKETAVVTIDCKRPCYYICLKPTGFRPPYNDKASFNISPLGFTYIEVNGIIEEKYTVNDDKSINIESNSISTKHNIVLQAMINNKWEKLFEVVSVPIQKLFSTSGKIKESMKTKMQAGTWAVHYDDRPLTSVSSHAFRVTVEKGCEGDAEWLIDSCALIPYKGSDVKQSGSALNKISLPYLRKCISESSLFHIINEGIVKLSTMVSINQTMRSQAISVMKKIIVSLPQLESVMKIIELKKFIELNIFYQDTRNANIGINFLQNIKDSKTFKDFIIPFISEQLNTVNEKFFTEAGLRALFEIASWNNQNNEYLNSMVAKALQICKECKTLYDTHTILLRTRLDVDSFPFSKAVYQIPCSKKNEVSTIQGIEQLRKTSLSSAILSTFNDSSASFILSLTDKSKIREIDIYFAKPPVDAISLKFKVVVKALEESSESLIFTKIYNEDTFDLLTSNKVNCNILIVPLISCECSYVSVEITFYGNSKEPNTIAANIQKITRDCLLVEAYGSSIYPKLKIPYIDALWGECELKELMVKRIEPSDTYKKMEAGKYILYLPQRESVKNEAVEVKKAVSEEKCNVDSDITQLRTQLHELCESYLKGKNVQTDISKAVGRIELLQRNEWENTIKDEKKYMSINGKECIEYLNTILLTLCESIMLQLKRKADNTKLESIKMLIENLFYLFIVCNKDKSKNIILDFILNTLMPLVASPSSIVITLINTYLKQSNVYFSQHSVITSIRKLKYEPCDILKSIDFKSLTDQKSEMYIISVLSLLYDKMPTTKYPKEVLQILTQIISWTIDTKEIKNSSAIIMNALKLTKEIINADNMESMYGMLSYSGNFLQKLITYIHSLNNLSLISYFETFIKSISQLCKSKDSKISDDILILLCQSYKLIFSQMVCNSMNINAIAELATNALNNYMNFFNILQRHEQLKANESIMVSVDMIKSLMKVISDQKAAQSKYFRELWDSILRLISLADMKKVIEEKLIDSLMDCFFLSNTECQQTIYTHMFNMFSSLLNNQTSNMSSMILSIIFASLPKTMNESNQLPFYLSKGLLEILLYSSTPQSNDDEEEKTKKEQFVPSVKLNMAETLSLLSEASNYIWHHLNFTVYKGVVGAYKTVKMAALLSARLFKLLSMARSKEDNNMNAIEYTFKNTQEIPKQQINRLVQWMMLNYYDEDSKVPIINILKSVTLYINTIFKKLPASANVAKYAIESLNNSYQQLSVHLLEMIKEKKPKVQSINLLFSKAQMLYIKLLKMLFKNTAAASYYAIEQKGISYLLSQLCNISIENCSSIPAVESDYLLSVSQIKSSESQGIDDEKAYTQLLGKTIPEEDFGKDMKIVECTGMTNSSSYSHTNWIANKSGCKTKVFTKEFISDKLNVNELSLTFKIRKQIEITEIEVGIIDFWNENNWDYIEPASIVVDIGNSQDVMSTLCVLDRISDRFIESNGAKVFAKNLTIASTGDDILSVMNSIKCAPATFIRFTFRQGITAAIMRTQGAKENLKKAICINYLSVSGVDASKQISPKDAIKESQKTAYTILNLFQQANLKESLVEFANNSELESMIYASFNNLCNFLNPTNRTIEPILIAFCSKNKKLNEWMITQLLTMKSNQACVQLLGDLCISSPENIEISEKILRNAIFKELKQVNTVDGKNEKCNALIPYIMEYVKILIIGSTLLKKEVEIDISYEQYNNLLSIIVMGDEMEKIDNALIKLAIQIGYPPKLFISKLSIIDQIASNSKFKSSRKLLSILALCGKDSDMDYLITELNDEKRIFSEIKTGNYDLIKMLLSFSQSNVLKKKMQSMRVATALYHLLKDPTNQTSGIFNFKPSIQENIITLIKLLMTPEETPQLASSITHDLDTVSSFSDSEPFVNIITNLIQTEAVSSVCIYPFDQNTGKWKSLTPADSLKEKQFCESSFISTQILSGSQRDTLKNKLRDRIGSSHKAWVSEWKKIYSETGIPSLNNKAEFEKFWADIGGKGPWIFLMKGTGEGKNVIVGAYSNNPFPDKPSTINANAVQDVKNHPQNLLFYYDDSMCKHFELKNKTDVFSTIYVDYSSIGALVIANYFISMSFSYSYSTSIGNANNLNSLDGQKMTYMPCGGFICDEVEIWECKLEQSSPDTDGEFIPNLYDINSCISHPWYSKCPAQALKVNAVFSVPNHITIEKLRDCMIGDSSVELRLKGHKEALDKSMKLEQIKSDIIELEFNYGKKLIPAIGSYTPQYILLPEIVNCNGLRYLLKTANDILMKKTGNITDMSKQFLSEILSMSTIPEFSKELLSNSKQRKFIFDIIIGKVEKQLEGLKDSSKENEENNFREAYSNAVTFIYKITAKIFAESISIEVREKMAATDFLQLILTRLQKITNENVRKVVNEEEEKLKKEEKTKKQEKQKESEKEKDKEENDGKEKKSEKKKRKGVGYVSGVGEVWDIDKYLKDKGLKNSQISQLMSILTNFFIESWVPPVKVLNLLLESCLLPLIENSFRSGSLLDMAKDYELFNSYFGFIRRIVKIPALVPILNDIEQKYAPKQMKSIANLLGDLSNLSTIFLSCLTSSVDDKNKIPKQLAEDIQRVNRLVLSSVKQKGEDTSAEIEKALQLPLQEAYHALLKDLRFDYMDMKDKTTYQHFYATKVSECQSISTSKMVRLAQELADLSNSLPYDHTNGIFVRVDKERIDMIKAIIMGASGTPYGHGAYEFDIFCCSSYPNEPPKMNLMTTGNGEVRFNPNLYSDGKVCLSLLGTWRGNATENWEPNISTILQVLMSTQAIIMSEEVYFNEPGFEGERNTPEGEKKNTGYGNIVKYCNIKFAMLGQLKKPSKGFESVIKRHFYIKKQEILQEVNQWLQQSTQDASYDGLIHDHNYIWCDKFKQSNTKYQEMLGEIIKELELELNKLEKPTYAPMMKRAKLGDGKKSRVSITDGSGDISQVNVDDDKEGENAHKNFDAASDEVKDRWSRYVGAMGEDAVAKQSKSVIFINGLGPTGIEIAKNIVLSGCKECIINDTKLVELSDLSGQFFVTEKDIGKNRVDACAKKLQQLNYFVKVKPSKTKITSETLPTSLNGSNVVIFTDGCSEEALLASEYCHQNNIKFIVAEVKGVAMRIFNDFGKGFTVYDKDGEELKEAMINSITNEKEGLVTVIKGSRHDFQNGDAVVIEDVVGMKAENSINGAQFTIKYVSPTQFRIGNTESYSLYERNGFAKQIKLANTMNYESFSAILKRCPAAIDANLIITDFAKTNDNNMLHIAFMAISEYVKKNSKLPGHWNWEDSNELLKMAEGISSQLKIELNDTHKCMLKMISFVASYEFPTLAAYTGAIAAHEIIKCITGKNTPINQLYYYHLLELLPITVKEVEKYETFKEIIKNVELPNTRDNSVSSILGAEGLRKLKKTSLFMVGVGAIGCELLKNYAMLSIGTEGSIIITDPDIIEMSNLNRQFLFREKHIRKPKSVVAAATVIGMNPLLNDKIIARLDKVTESTINVYNDDFYKGLTVVTNALDNVEARRYIDSRCVANKKPLIESGTLGTKGHVQVVIPFKTESYSSQNDPVEEKEIPHCTLKMFPEEAVHCIEWARDKFGKIFALQPRKILQGIEKLQSGDEINAEGVSLLKILVKYLEIKPTTFDDCISYARNKFESLFSNSAKQLIHIYPPEHKNKDGSFFWTTPKRPPHSIQYNHEDQLHAFFISACACLRAKTFGIAVPDNPRSEKTRKALAEKASKITPPEFTIDQSKIASIASEVENDKTNEKPKESEESNDLSEKDALLDKYDNLMSNYAGGQLAFVEEFEKDNDSNFHIDFIYAASNLRCRNYGLNELPWLSVKIKAGRIVPALATTTAAIAALQTLELVKLINGNTNALNSFINIALPAINLSDPGEVKKNKIREDLVATIWDTWDITLPNGKNSSLSDVMNELHAKYKLVVRDVIYRSSPIFLHAVMNAPDKKADKENLLNSSLFELIEIDEADEYVDINATFSYKQEDNTLIQGIPSIRVWLKKAAK